MENDVLDTAAKELEDSIRQDEQASTKDEAGAIRKAIETALQPFLAKAKAKGGMETDKKAEMKEHSSMITAGKDPAEHPKKSGAGYSDSSKYEARKGHDEEEEEEEDCDDDMPAFFKKKSKKKGKKVMKKSDDEVDADEESDEDVIDATEFMEDMGEAMEYLNKSVARLEEGVAVFGELLTVIADPRKENLLTNIAKGMTFLINENKELKKSVASQQSLMKAVAQMPGIPRVAGLQAVSVAAEEAGSTEASGRSKLSKSIVDRLFNLAATKQITMEEYKSSLKNGDATILERFGK